MKIVLRLFGAILAVSALSWLAISQDATASENGADETIKTKGENGVKINKIVFSTLRFSPEDTEIESGGTLAFKHADKTQDPHSLSIVDEAGLPVTVDDVFNCGGPGTACEPFGAHFPPDGPPVPVLNEGAEGLDTVGDSLFIQHGETVTATVSAAPGTTLSFLCFIHPWMQGSIEVEGGGNGNGGDGDNDNDDDDD